MADQDKFEGCDLAAEGLALAELADGAMALGHVNGEPVLIARRGSDVFAVSARCTHYGGPLDQGLLVSDTIRCPWHHAAFSLRTGEAARAPALNPLACWTVEHRDGRVYARAKRERDPLIPMSADLGEATTVGAAHPVSVIIIGAGAAGSAAAEMLRRAGYRGRITMIDGDDAAPYDRPNLSKDYLAGRAPEDWIPLRPAASTGSTASSCSTPKRPLSMSAAARSVSPWLIASVRGSAPRHRRRATDPRHPWS
jgi:nitrite reductase/ring-hydroxylating ferredoxin subunit